MGNESESHTFDPTVILDDIETTSGGYYYGVVTAEESGSETTEFYCSNLIGWGDDDFISGYYVQIRRTTDDAAPIGEVQKVSDYVTADGHFTVSSAFTANVNTGDVIELIHESHIAMGRNDADNTFDSSAVVANEDGSALERLEQIQEATNRGTGTSLAANTSLPDALGTDGATVTDSAITVIGPMGANNANNAFDSTLVVANRDGSLLERSEFVIEKLDGPAMLLDWVQSEGGTAEEDGYLRFQISVIDKESGAIAAADIDITGIAQTMYRSRSTVASGAWRNTGITQPTFAKDTGTIYDGYRYIPAQWRAGDTYRLILSGIVVTIGGETMTLPTYVWTGIVEQAHDALTQIEAMKGEVDDLSEAHYLTCSLQTFLERSSAADRYVRVEVIMRDLDGDLADPANNELGVYVLNNASANRTGNCYKDVAGAANLDLIGVGVLATYRQLMRTDQGQYYFFYEVGTTHALEELIFRFGWQEMMYYEMATDEEYVVFGTQIVSPVNVKQTDTNALTDQDITTEVEITTGNALIVPAENIYRAVIRARDINQTSAGCTLTLRVVFNDGTDDLEVFNDEVEISAGETDALKTSNPFYCNAAGTVKMYITSDDAADTTAGLDCWIVEGNV